MLQTKLNNKVISLMGPTASGKTDLALNLLKNNNLEIISVDSVMFYREFNIGSAKPEKNILQKYPHRLVNILDPFERYSVAMFYKDLLVQIKEVHLNRKTPLLVGGSMMYFKTFFSGGLSNLSIVSEEIKNKINDMLKQNDLNYLYNFLMNVDKNAAKKIHYNDKYRIIRMLEIYFSNKEKPSDLLKRCSKNVQYFNNLNISIIPKDRTFIHNNIENRFDNMIKKGFLEEVLQIRKKYKNLKLPAMSTIGYKQASEYLNGNIDKETMRDSTLAATRQLAKRQITWLRHLDGTTVYTCTDYDNIDKTVKNFLAN